MVRALKYGSVSSAAAVLADGMEKAVPPGRFDVQVPVPLHSMRERQRGFNQARLLSESLSRLTGIPTVDALIRIRATQTQTRLSREDRAENVLGAFQLRMPVEGLSILLVDDVLTTGATAVSCAEALKEAGARGVWLITAALANAGLDG